MSKRINISGGRLGYGSKQGATTVVSTPDIRQLKKYPYPPQNPITLSGSLFISGSSSDYAYIPTNVHNGALNITGNISIECWVKFSSLAGTHTLASKWDDGDFQYRFYYDHLNSYLGFDISEDGTTSSTVTGSVSVNIDQWYHFAITADNVGETPAIRFYSSSILLGTGSLGNITLSTGNSEFRVGITQSGSSDVLSGSIDELRVWNDQRSSTEIGDYMHLTLVGNEANLVGYWQFDFSSPDITSNDNYLIPVNGTLFTTASFVEIPT